MTSPYFSPTARAFNNSSHRLTHDFASLKLRINELRVVLIEEQEKQKAE